MFRFLLSFFRRKPVATLSPTPAAEPLKVKPTRRAKAVRKASRLSPRRGRRGRSQ